MTSYPEASELAPVSWRSQRAYIAAVERHYPDHDTTELRRDLRARRAEDYIRSLVEESPTLSDAQRARLAALLRPAGRAA